MRLIPSFEDYTALFEVSRGRRPPTLVLRGGTVYNPFTLSFEKGDVAVWKKWIARVGDVGLRGEEEIDVDGFYVLPGFIDPHCHPDLFYNPFTFFSYAPLRGLTACLADIHDFSTSVGLSNYLRFVLFDAKGIPVKLFLTVPAINPPNPEVEGDWVIPGELLERLSEVDEIRGVSESTSWVRFYEGDFLERIYPFFSKGKTVEGHAPGARSEKLSVLSLLGFTSDHECISFEDVVERLKLGLWVFVREGSIRGEFGRIIPGLSERPELLSRVCLTADGVFPDHLVERGYMDFVVRRAVEEGLPPEWAIRMVTLNPAEYLGVSRFIGSISPGKVADMLVVESLRDPTPLKVFLNGKPYERSIPSIPGSYITGRFPFELSLDGLFPKRFGTIPVIHVENLTITRLRNLDVKNSEEFSRLGCNYVLLIHRQTGEVGRGILHGYGFLDGGFTVSVSHETHHILSLGGREEDIVLSLKRVVESGGGISVFSHGKELFFLDLPFGRTMSTLPVEELGSRIKEARRILSNLGSFVEDPLWCAVFLSFTGLPEVRITPKGVFDVKRRRIVYNG